MSLHLVGHIPPVADVEAFLADRRPRKHFAIVDKMLDESAFGRNFATTWSNILIGRKADENVDREAFHQYLRQQFTRNRPWSETVAELVSSRWYES